MTAKRDLTPEEQESLLHHIASGKFLRVWCRERADADNSADAIRQRVDIFNERTPAFKALYEKARLIGADEIALDAVDLIDIEPKRTVTGGYDSAEVQWRKNQAYFRMEALKKWFPQKYGDKVTQEHEAGAGLLGILASMKSK